MDGLASEHPVDGNHKSQGQPPGSVLKPCKLWDKIPYQLVNAGFLNHQQSHLVVHLFFFLTNIWVKRVFFARFQDCRDFCRKKKPWRDPKIVILQKPPRFSFEIRWLVMVSWSLGSRAQRGKLFRHAKKKGTQRKSLVKNFWTLVNHFFCC